MMWSCEPVLLVKEGSGWTSSIFFVRRKDETWRHCCCWSTRRHCWPFCCSECDILNVVCIVSVCRRVETRVVLQLMLCESKQRNPTGKLLRPEEHRPLPHSTLPLDPWIQTALDHMHSTTSNKQEKSVYIVFGMHRINISHRS